MSTFILHAFPTEAQAKDAFKRYHPKHDHHYIRMEVTGPYGSVRFAYVPDTQSAERFRGISVKSLIFAEGLLPQVRRRLTEVVRVEG